MEPPPTTAVHPAASTPTAVRFLDLPDDVLGLVIRRLPPSDALRGVAPVCQRLRDVAYGSVTELCVIRPEVELARFPALECVEVRFYKPASFEWLLGCQHTLRSLVIHRMWRCGVNVRCRLGGCTLCFAAG